MRPFSEQEQFSGETVEAVTSVQTGTLRQWERRGIYTCELRWRAPAELTIYRCPDNPKRINDAKEYVEKFNRGWRSYTLGDLVRITVLRKLIDLGIEGQVAGQCAQGLQLPESDGLHVPDGRDHIRELHKVGLECGDEFIFFYPVINIVRAVRLTPPPQARDQLSPKMMNYFLDDWFDKLKSLFALHGSAAIVLNLSEIRRSVLAKLETVEATRVG